MLEWGFGIDTVARSAGVARADYLSRVAYVSTNATQRSSNFLLSNLRGMLRGSSLAGYANAIAATNTKKVKGYNAVDTFGIVFSRSRSPDRTEGALSIYASGGTITPQRGQFLWFVPKNLSPFISQKIQGRNRRFRLTPERYYRSGLATQLGRLQFVQLPGQPNMAFLVVKQANISKKTGRLSRSRRRTKNTVDFPVVFIGVKQTTRDKSYDLDGARRAAHSYQLKTVEKLWDSGRKVRRFRYR